jgi:hypothetical protein
MKKVLLLISFIIISFFSSAQKEWGFATEYYARYWYASHFGVYPNDCMEDGAGIQRAIDSAAKMKGRTLFIFDKGLENMRPTDNKTAQWLQEMNNRLDKETWHYCSIDSLNLSESLSFGVEIDNLLGYTIYTGSCPPCQPQSKVANNITCVHDWSHVRSTGTLQAPERFLRECSKCNSKQYGRRCDEIIWDGETSKRPL